MPACLANLSISLMWDASKHLLNVTDVRVNELKSEQICFYFLCFRVTPTLREPCKIKPTVYFCDALFYFFTDVFAYFLSLDQHPVLFFFFFLQFLNDVLAC